MQTTKKHVDSYTRNRASTKRRTDGRIVLRSRSGINTRQPQGRWQDKLAVYTTKTGVFCKSMAKISQTSNKLHSFDSRPSCTIHLPGSSLDMFVSLHSSIVIALDLASNRVWKSGTWQNQQNCARLIHHFPQNKNTAPTKKQHDGR